MVGLCLLLPACVAMQVQIRRNGGKMLSDNILLELFRYGRWVLAVNFIAMGFTAYIVGRSDMEEYLCNFHYAVKYLVLSTLIAFIVPYLLEIYHKYISVTFTVGERNEEEKK